MTNGDGQVIVALLLMAQRARSIEVALHGRAQRGQEVAGVIGAVVLANRRINRSCTSSMRQRGPSGRTSVGRGQTQACSLT
jgi:hypothetical protein